MTRLILCLLFGLAWFGAVVGCGDRTPPKAGTAALKTSTWNTEQSWTSLNKVLLKILRSHSDRISTHDDMSEAEEFQQFQSEATYEDLNTVLVDCQDPLVRLAAYYIVKQRFPQNDVYAAAQLIASGEHASKLLVSPAAEDIHALVNSKESRQRLDSIQSVQWPRYGTCLLTVGLIDFELLWSYYHEKEGHIEQPFRDAIVTDLYRRGFLLRRQPSEYMKQQIDALKSRPYDSLRVYMWFADTNTPDYKERFEKWLNDEDTFRQDLKAAVTLREDWIRTELEKSTLRLSSERRALLQEFLKELDQEDSEPQ